MAAHARGFSVQLGVLRALLVRDALMRYGHENLGFFWIILEPLMFAMGVAAIWTAVNLTHGQVSTVTFALSGYILLTYFRHVVNSCVRIVRRNLGLRFHANIKPLDIYTARVILESLGCLAAFFVAYFPLTALGIIDPMRDPLLTMGAYGLQVWFCFSFGLILAALSEIERRGGARAAGDDVPHDPAYRVLHNAGVAAGQSARHSGVVAVGQYRGNVSRRHVSGRRHHILGCLVRRLVVLRPDGSRSHAFRLCAPPGGHGLGAMLYAEN